MIYDSRMQFSAAQDITCTAGATVNSTNIYDSGSVTRDLGQSADLFFAVEVTQDIVAAGGGTFTIQLVSSASASLTAPNVHASTTLTTQATNGTVANKTAAGCQAMCTAFPANGLPYLEYIGVIYGATSQNVNSGKVNAYTMLDPVDHPVYPGVANLV